VSKFTVKEIVKRIVSIFLLAKTQAFWNGTCVCEQRESKLLCPFSSPEPPSWSRCEFPKGKACINIEFIYGRACVFWTLSILPFFCSFGVL
jgi:hypothetical protein